MRHRRMERPEEDPTGILTAVRDFNQHSGPARLFYNRNSRTFFVNVYGMGYDRWFGEMCNGLDIVELYRKTSESPDVKVTAEELMRMESEILPYSVW